MTDEALKKFWQNQPIDLPAIADQNQLAAVKRKTKRFDRTIFWRDGRELLAGGFVVLMSSVALLFGTGSFLTNLGYLVLLISAILIDVRIIFSKRRLPQVNSDAPVFETVRVESLKVQNQIKLLKSVWWWYLLPICTGILLIRWGGSEAFGHKVVDSIRVLLICGVIYWFNLYATHAYLQPLCDELESMLNPEAPITERKPNKKRTVLTIMIIIIAMILFFAVGQLAGKDAQSAAPQAGIQEGTNITQTLESIRAKHKLPSLAAAVIFKGQTVASGAVGVRKHGGTEKVTTADKFHIGSVTKSMTATLAAMLVEQGKISWTTTIGEQFPELLSEIHPVYHSVTLQQLLAHQGGAPGSPPTDLWIAAWNATGTPPEQRLSFIKGILSGEPAELPGKRHIYSNAGYTIAGVMLEKASGKTWEDMMRSMLFEPLGMASAGFGAPATIGKIDHPWGHKAGVLSIIAISPGPKADNPLAISPAGAVHCSVEDLAKYAAFHLAGERGEGTLLKADTFKKLHKAIGKDEYALGWVVAKRQWAGGNALMHNGSNTMFYVVVWIAPKRDFAVVVATNAGADYAFSGCDDAAWNLIQYFITK